MADDPGRIPFEKHRFRSAVAYYGHRTAYPPALIDWVARRTALGPSDRVLDLGCGPGTLAVPFARLGCEVVALDPEPAMLAAARSAAQREGVTVTLVEASSDDLEAIDGPFRIVTMGRSFHWMDRQPTLEALERLVEPGGAVVLFGDERLWDDGWRAVYDRLAEAYDTGGLTARAARRAPGWLPHEAVMAASPFPCMERHGFVMTETLTADDIVGRAYSYSATSPDRLADRREEFEAELRTALAELSPADRFSAIVEPWALVAERANGAVRGHG
jgi:SAM-dependent methyltransferase